MNDDGIVYQASCRALPCLASVRACLLPTTSDNMVPGVPPYEKRGYWRDIGTIDAYNAAQRDVLGPLPCFSLVNDEWPILGKNRSLRKAISTPATRPDYQRLADRLSQSIAGA